MSIRRLFASALGLAALGVIGSAGAASLTTSGYAENFDEIGTGTALPSGWISYIGTGSNNTWTTSIPGTGVAAMTPTGGGSAGVTGTSAALTVNNSLTTGSTLVASTNGNGINAINPFGTSTDRVLVSSPTGVDGTAWQLTLANSTGAALSSINVSYDVIRFNVTNTGNSGSYANNPYGEELPGLELFYSTDGTTWNNAAWSDVSNTTSPTYTTTTGENTFSGTLSLASAVANGSNIYLRWVDDNGELSSPDQDLGLNNVNVAVAPVPLPAGLPLLASALGALGLFGRRRQQNA